MLEIRKVGLEEAFLAPVRVVGARAQHRLHRGRFADDREKASVRRDPAAEPVGQRVDRAGHDNGVVALARREIAQGIANLEGTFSGIGETQITGAATALLKARKVWVIGFRASAPFATYLQWQLTQVIENVVAIPGAGQTFGEHLASIRKNDVVVFFGLRRRVAQTDRLLKQIDNLGAKVLYVTDESADFNKRVAWHFRCQTLTPGPLFNHTAVMALCHLLITRSIEIAGAEGRVRLRNIEALNDALDEL